VHNLRNILSDLGTATALLVLQQTASCADSIPFVIAIVEDAARATAIVSPHFCCLHPSSDHQPMTRVASLADGALLIGLLIDSFRDDAIVH